MSRVSALASITFAFLLTATLAVAQLGDAEITGLVKDPSNAPIPGATLTLVNEDSGVTRTATSDEVGRYRLLALPPGRYSLKVELPGFRPETITGIVLNIGTHVDRDIALSVGNLQDAVTVTGEVPPIDTSSATVGGVLRAEQIATLPINTRQYLNLALLMPGTTQDASRSFYNNVQSGGGGRYYANGFSVDGVTNTWAEMGEPRQNLPAGSVQEFKINTNQFKAEQGLAMGGMVTVVTKSGTNEFHGDAFEYFRDAALNRDNIFQKQTELLQGTGKAPFRRNQFGGDFGGPIVRNRTHFYAAFERTQTRQSFTIFTGAAGHQFYSANEGTFNQPIHDQLFNIRGDHEISKNQHLFGRYSQEWNLLSYQGCGGASEANCYTGEIPRKAVVIGHTWTPTPTIINEFRFQYGYASYQLGPPGAPNWTDLGSFPSQRTALLGTVYNFPSFSYGFGYGDLGKESRYQFKDDVSLVLGAHVFKFGFDTSHIPFGDDTDINLNGTWTFGTDQVFDPRNPATIAALKSPTQYTAALPPQYTQVPVTQLGLFIQDDWRARQDLTLSFGLRWDREYGSFNEKLNPKSFPQPIPFLGDPSKRGDTNNFGPRFGLAWNVRGSGKDVVRGGFGVYYNNLQTLQNFNENRNLLQCNVLISRPNYPDPFGGNSPSAFCSTAPPNITLLAGNYANPYTEQFTGGYSRQLTGDFSIHADGIFTHTLRDYRTVDLNYPVNGVRPLPAWGRILMHDSISQSKYKAMYLRAEKRFSRRYQFLTSYTLASARDDSPQSQIVNPSNYNLDWGPAGVDRRHALVAGGSVEVRWGVTIGAIWNVRSALPFSTQSATLDADGVRQYVPGTSRGQGNRDLNLDTINAYRATLNLAPIPASQIDSSRFNSFDIRATKSFRIREHQSVQFIGQVFNLFGHLNLTGGTTGRADSANFGRILSAGNLQQAEFAMRFAF